MTMTELPRRPFAEQAPPVDGLEQVRGAARGRRRRRAMAVTGGGVGAAAAAIAAVLVLAGGPGGVDVLRPVQPAHDIGGVPHRGSAGHHAAEPASPTHRAGQRPAAAHRAAVTRTGGGQSTSRPGPSQQSDPRTTRSTQTMSVAAPELRRYRTSTAVGSQINVCPGDASSTDQSATTSGVGWCVQASVSQVSGGERLHFQACRDDTTAGSLTFSGSREVDLVVQHGGHTVWDWAHDHPDAPRPHQLSATAGQCWNWDVVWPDITQSGASAGHAAFTFVATTSAQELAGYPAQKVTFAY